MALTLDPEEPVAVLVADAQRLVADALGRALAPVPGIRALEAIPTSGLAACDAIELLKPDVCLIDYWLPELQAPGIIRLLAGRREPCKVIVLCWMDATREVENAMFAGAAGVVPKRVSVDRLADAVARIRSGKRVVLAEGQKKMAAKLRRRDNPKVGDWRVMRQLTPRELELIALLGQGLLVEDVSARLSLSRRTVSNYLQSAFIKTGVHSQTHLLAMARHCDIIA